MERINMTDEQLAALIDNKVENEECVFPYLIDDIEIVNATRKAIKLERKPSYLKRILLYFRSWRWSKNSPVSREIYRLAFVPCLAVVALVFIMISSPLSQQYNENITFARGVENDNILDSLIQQQDYQTALELVNAEIVERSNNLPKMPYFDRFHPKQERYEISLSRAEIYELRWKKMEILSAQHNITALRKELKGYSSIIGYHQEEAKDKLKQLGGK